MTLLSTPLNILADKGLHIVAFEFGRYLIATTLVAVVAWLMLRTKLKTRKIQQRNRQAIKAKRMDVSISAVEALPYGHAQFDKVMSVHTIYFWKCLDRAFQEIARVTKPGGLLVLAFRTSEATASTRNFPSEVYTFRSLGEISEALIEVGFSIQKVDGDPAASDPLVLIARCAD